MRIKGDGNFFAPRRDAKEREEGQGLLAFSLRECGDLPHFAMAFRFSPKRQQALARLIGALPSLPCRALARAWKRWGMGTWGVGSRRQGHLLE